MMMRMIMSLTNIDHQLLITYTERLLHLYCSLRAFHGRSYGGHLTTTTTIVDIVVVSDL